MSIKQGMYNNCTCTITMYNCTCKIVHCNCTCTITMYNCTSNKRQWLIICMRIEIYNMDGRPRWRTCTYYMVIFISQNNLDFKRGLITYLKRRSIPRQCRHIWLFCILTLFFVLEFERSSRVEWGKSGRRGKSSLVNSEGPMRMRTKPLVVGVNKICARNFQENFL